MPIAIDIFHNSLSFLFVVFTAWVLVRAFRGWRGKLEWLKRDYYSSVALVVIMYLQMLLGLYLFFSAHYLSGGAVAKSSELRFWPVEHFFTMIFALLVAQLGLVIAVNTKKHADKHRVIFVYFSISLVFTFFSLAMILRG